MSEKSIVYPPTYVTREQNTHNPLKRAQILKFQSSENECFILEMFGRQSNMFPGPCPRRVDSDAAPWSLSQVLFTRGGRESRTHISHANTPQRCSKADHGSVERDVRNTDALGVTSLKYLR